MDINTTTSVPFSVIPDDNYVKNLRKEGYEVHVFRGKEKGMNFVEGKMVEKTVERRMVAIKFPYAEDGEYVYDTYDSALENKGLFPIRTLIERDVEALRNDPTFTHEGPLAAGITTGDDTHDGVLEGEEEALRNNPIFITTGESEF
ncbi:MAG: hypothetical protein LBF49_03095 [Puniceicoccales bacterium]|jgi:hypothetical protein|nr:hypothetical protein [Puniceicoccales bacterium]